MGLLDGLFFSFEPFAPLYQDYLLFILLFLSKSDISKKKKQRTGNNRGLLSASQAHFITHPSLDTNMERRASCTGIVVGFWKID